MRRLAAQATAIAVAMACMGAGGERKLISFTDGRLDQSYYQKRTGDGDFCIVYNKDGEIVYAYAYLYKGTNKGSYNYDESTGLFSGKKLSELGYNDSDINVPAPAAVGDRKDPNRITAYIIRCYRNILGREPEADELNTWNGELSSGRQTAAGIADQLWRDICRSGTLRSWRMPATKARKPTSTWKRTASA